MPAPDGNTYEVEGPDGASDDAVRAEIMRQHPSAGTKSPYGSPAGSAQKGGNWMNDVSEALGGGFVKIGNALRQINSGNPVQPETGEVLDQSKQREAVQADIAEHARLDKPLESTPGGKIGGFAAKAIPFALAPEGYVGAGAAGALTGALEPTQEGGPSRAGNMVTGGAGGVIGNAVGGVIGSGVSAALRAGKSALDDVAQDAIQVLKSHNIFTTMGQQTGKALAPTAEAAAQQSKDLTTAALKQMGVDSTRASTAVLDAGRRRLQNTYDDLAANLSVKVDKPLVDALTQTHAAAGEYLTEPVAKVVQKQVDGIIGKIVSQGGRDVNGTLFKNLHDGLDKIADPSATPIVEDLQQAMRAAMTRSSTPEQAALLSKTDQQYGAMKAIEKAIGTNERIDPTKLYNATDTTQGAAASVYGRGPNAPLAQLGQAAKLIMVDAVNKGGVSAKAITDYAEKRLAFHAITSVGPATLGGYEGYKHGGMTGALTGIALALGGAKLARQAGSNPAIANAIGKWANNVGVKNAAEAAAYLAKQGTAAGGSQIAPQVANYAGQGQTP